MTGVFNGYPAFQDMELARKEFWQNWEKENGGEPIESDQLRGWALYPSGALREIPLGGGPSQYRNPPKDDHARLSLQLIYAEERLRKAVEKFDNRKQHLTVVARNLMASGGGAPPSTELEKLKALKAEAERWKGRVAKIREQFDATPEEKRRREREAMEAEQRQVSESFLADLKAIEI